METFRLGSARSVPRDSDQLGSWAELTLILSVDDQGLIPPIVRRLTRAVSAVCADKRGSSRL